MTGTGGAAVAGYLAGLPVGGDAGLAVIGHTALGIVGALVGGFLANALGFGNGGSNNGDINVLPILVSASNSGSFFALAFPGGSGTIPAWRVRPPHARTACCLRC